MNTVRAEKDLGKVVASFCEEHSLFDEGDRVVVGVSGGADSTALLHILLELAPKWKLTLAVAHLNHKLRGRDAEEDQEFVTGLAQKHNLPTFIESEAVKELAKRRGEGTEEAGRFARYLLFNRAKKRFGAQKVALGHTASDLVETFLARLMRGSASGLYSIAPKRRDDVVRPLLGVWRRDILTYLLENDIPFREDVTNLDENYERNRIRHQLLPLLREEFNPRVEEALMRTVLLLSRDEEYLGVQAEQALSTASSEGESVPDKDETILKTTPLAKLHPAVLSRIIRLLASRLSPGYPPAAERVEGLMELIYAGGSGCWWLLPNFGAEVSSGKVRFFCDDSAKVADKRYSTAVDHSRPKATLSVPGETRIGEEVSIIQVVIIPKDEYSPSPADESALTLLLDAEKVKGELHARAPKKGDRFRPQGLGGSKLLSDLFTDLKIPVWERKRAVVIEDGEGILGVVGLRADERATPDESSQKYMLISLLE